MGTMRRAKLQAIYDLTKQLFHHDMKVEGARLAPAQSMFLYPEDWRELRALRKYLARLENSNANDMARALGRYLDACSVQHTPSLLPIIEFWDLWRDEVRAAGLKFAYPNGDDGRAVLCREADYHYVMNGSLDY